MARERERVQQDGGDLAKLKKKNGAANVFIAGKLGPGFWLWSELDGIVRMQTLAVYDGYAYLLDCEIPAVKYASTNVRLLCTSRGATFHLAPPN